MFLIPPYRRRVYTTSLSPEQIIQIVRNEFSDAIDNNVLSSGRGVVEVLFDRDIHLKIMPSTFKSAQINADIVFDQSIVNQFAVTYYLEPLNYMFRLVAVTVIYCSIFSGAPLRASDFLWFFVFFAALLIMFSYLQFYPNADAIEKFVEERLLA